MPNAMAPEGYRAQLLGSAASIEELGDFVPLEESSDEGALFLMRLNLSDYPTDEALSRLEQTLVDAGVEM